MDEQTWLTCTDPQPMLEFLHGRASERKIRLFGCGCCRRLWNLLSDKYSRKALTVAERYADGEVSEDKLGFAWGNGRRAAQVAYRQERETAEASAMWAVSMLCEVDLGRAVAAVGLAARCEAYPIDQLRLAEAQGAQLVLLRDIVINPFHPVALDPAWLTPTVVSLAKAAYTERELPSGHLAHACLAVLADALEEAGCAHEEVLGHLRGPGPHPRGCHVLDRILGRE